MVCYRRCKTSHWAAPLLWLLTCSAANINQIFAPHVDCGDHVIIINAEKAVLTGKKLVQKVHYHHSGWIGGMKAIRYDKLMKENPEKAMMLAVKGMVPDTTIGRQALTRCRIYRGSEHNHAAQKPEQF